MQAGIASHMVAANVCFLLRLGLRSQELPNALSDKMPFDVRWIGFLRVRRCCHHSGNRQEKSRNQKPSHGDRSSADQVTGQRKVRKWYTSYIRMVLMFYYFLGLPKLFI